MATRILLADDHKIMREGLRALIEKQPHFEIVGQAADGRTTVRLAQELMPDVIIMDIGMPELNGIEATRRIKAIVPKTRIIALSMYYDKRFVFGMLGAGASGYLRKDCALDELVTAIQVVAENGTYLSPRVAGAGVKRYVNHLSKSNPVESARLTDRQREVLQSLSEGKNTKQIASALMISVKTVETHILNVKEKLDIHSTAELTRYAIREGLTFLEPDLPSSDS
jgi:two-component system, NarL family, response regulator NreC